MTNLCFHSYFVFRTPALPFSDITDISELAQQKDFQNAIYFASPSLYSEMLRWLKGELKTVKEIYKLIHALQKYTSRMRSRSTPYGLFASCGTGKWAEKNCFSINETRILRTRLDMDFLCSLIRVLEKDQSIKSFLKFTPNTSIYCVGKKLRYVEFQYLGKKRIHKTSCVDASDYLLQLFHFARNGKTISELVSFLICEDISLEEATAFVNEVVETQLLVSELEVSITGEDTLQQIVSFLSGIDSQNLTQNIGEKLRLLYEIKNIFDALDLNHFAKKSEYEKAVTLVAKLNVPFEEKHLFQVDSFVNPSKYLLTKQIQEKISSAADFLYKLVLPYSNGDLDNFKIRYFELYELQEMPLLTVLDTETGIGYPMRDIKGVNLLVDNLGTARQNSSNSIEWNSIESFLLLKLMEAKEKKNYSVDFFPDEIRPFLKEKGQLPVSLSVMFKITDAVQNIVQLKSIGGCAGAAVLLGRFAYGNKTILEIVDSITSYEQKRFDGRIIAEIIHQPDDRVGNILIRPSFRKYEIPYLAKASVRKEFQILPEDLFVSIKDNRIVIRSKRLNKEIIPRLSSAHNYSYNSLPLYKFLCDLQLQDVEKPSLIFGWGSLSSTFKFLPRAEYNGVVLFPATWNLSANDFAELCKQISLPTFLDEVNTWKEKWKMPKWIVLKDGDNELLVDFDNELSIKTFFNEIKNRKAIQLSEFLFDPENALIKDEKGNPYTNEIIAIVFNHDYKPSETIVFPENKFSENSIPIKRSFIPGSEWLYYKIYCGVKTADDILRDTIKPLIENLSRNGLIEKWFFIRYADPDIHIRLRFYNSDAFKLNEVMKLMNSALHQMHEQGVISKIMTDTYNRELERYGQNTMEISEKLFELDSWATLNLLQLAQGETADELKWQYAIRSLDSMMDSFGFDISRKLNLMEILKTNFIAEHSTGKDLKVQLDNKFRKMRPQLNDLFAKNLSDLQNKWPAKEILNWKNASSQAIIEQILKLESQGELMVNLNDLIASYMHMCINRIFKSQQRKHEMVIYDQLYRFYKSKIAQEKANITRTNS